MCMIQAHFTQKFVSLKRFKSKTKKDSIKIPSDDLTGFGVVWKMKTNHLLKPSSVSELPSKMIERMMDADLNL